MFPKGAHWGTGVSLAQTDQKFVFPMVPKFLSEITEKPEEKDKNAGAAPTKAEETKKADKEADKKPKGHFETAATNKFDTKPAELPICNGRNKGECEHGTLV